MKRTGFTLIELLVVIAIIALLMSLTAAVLRRSRAQAKAVKCGSNVRQLTFGLFMYAGEEETFPCGFRPTFEGSDDHLGSADMDPVGLWWINCIERLAERADDEDGVFCCPSRKLDIPKLEDNVLWGNYGVNRSICRTYPPLKLKKKELTGTPLGPGNIPHAGQTLLIVDSGYSMINWWFAADDPPWAFGNRPEDFSYVPGLVTKADRNLLPGQLWDAVTGRHPNKTVNVGFVDGHISSMKAQDLSVGGTEDAYRNRTPLWTPN
jgi:prepilin-type N-terminal cleavage/methylation domain-containing protein/prepilin-type processing-associated H-X9-DG protein